MARECPIEVDHVNPAGPLPGPLTGDGRGIVREDGLSIGVSVSKSNTTAPSDVYRGIDGHPKYPFMVRETMHRLSPIIGITAKWEYASSSGDPSRVDGTHLLPETYVRSVRAAGGLPVLLPATFDSDACAEYLSLCDGILFSGGGDVNPALFGEEPTRSLGTVDPLRDAFERNLCQEALALDIPIFAICRGVQLLNVAAGGTLIQDIPSSFPNALQHAQKSPLWHPSHAITLEPDTLLYRLLGVPSLYVNSFHHQAVGVVAPGFRVSARSSDGIVEAIESTRHRFALGVQFHPEGSGDRDPKMRALFAGFVEEARSARRRLASGEHPRLGTSKAIPLGE
jgi:putative glutamine amidotransferase